jgi:hypothetical protein
MFFLIFLLNDRRIQEAQKHVDPVDPHPDSDPQHFFSITHCTKSSRVRSMIFLPWQPDTQEHIKKRQEAATSREGAALKNGDVNFLACTVHISSENRSSHLKILLESPYAH